MPASVPEIHPRTRCPRRFPRLSGRLARWLVLVGFALVPLFAQAKYKVDIHAPRDLRKLLEAHLDLARFADRDDLTDDEYRFLVAAVPRQVTDLLETQAISRRP